jgi:hypothetical protein
MSEPVVEMDFEKELTDLLKKHGFNVYTHDSVMARFIMRAIDSFRESLREYNQIQAEMHATGKTNDDVRIENTMGSETP